MSGGQRKKLVIAMALINDPKILLLDEPFAALDILTIKMLQEIIVNLQQENKITICICDHQARDLLACVDVAMILSNGKVVAQDTPSNLVNNISTIEETKKLISIKTRQYAKRQGTWARGQMQSWEKINPKNLSLVIKNLK